MIQNETLWNELYNAAETIYKFMDAERGFYSGKKKREDNTVVKTYNQYSGACVELEYQLKRKLNDKEKTVLAIAVGDRNQKCLKRVLTQEEIDTIFTDLWNNQPNRNHDCLTFDRLVTCI